MKNIIISLLFLFATSIAMGQNTTNDSVVVDYNFNVVYAASTCLEDGLPQQIKLYMFDAPRYNYIAPRLATSETSLIEYIHKRIFAHYQELCSPENELPIERVVVEFTISEEGKISSVFVVESASELYDKEAVRLVRSLKFLSPAFRYGEAKKLCIRLPILFDPALFCPK